MVFLLQELEGAEREACGAAYSLLRGFLNAAASEDAPCADRFLCEAWEEAAMQGPLAATVADLAV